MKKSIMVHSKCRSAAYCTCLEYTEKYLNITLMRENETVWFSDKRSANIIQYKIV